MEPFDRYICDGNLIGFGVDEKWWPILLKKYKAKKLKIILYSLDLHRRFFYAILRIASTLKLQWFAEARLYWGAA